MVVRWVWLVVTLAGGCGRISFDGVGAAADAGRPDGGPVGATCQVDGDCAACLRCRASTCETEPINQVFLGHQSTCFIGAEGSRWCTGDGNGVVDDPGTGYPVRREGEDGWSQIELGFGVGWGIRGNALWGWSGADAPGEVAVGSWSQLSTEDNVLCARDTLSILDCGQGPMSSVWLWVDEGFGKRCAIDDSERLFCWGQDESNALGLGVEADGTDVPTPTQVGTDQDWERVAIGGGLACALKVNHTLWCWGRSDSTGTNNVDTLGVPTMISPDADWASLDVHWYHGCARKLDGRYFCWGHGEAHEVVPGMIDVPVPTEMPGNWDELVMGGHHYCGRVGATWSCWGWNAAGQLGVGGTEPRTTPTPLCGR